MTLLPSPLPAPSHRADVYVDHALERGFEAGVRLAMSLPEGELLWAFNHLSEPAPTFDGYEVPATNPAGARGLGIAGVASPPLGTDHLSAQLHRTFPRRAPAFYRGLIQALREFRFAYRNPEEPTPPRLARVLDRLHPQRDRQVPADWTAPEPSSPRSAPVSAAGAAALAHRGGTH